MGKFASKIHPNSANKYKLTNMKYTAHIPVHQSWGAVYWVSPFLHQPAAAVEEAASQVHQVHQHCLHNLQQLLPGQTVPWHYHLDPLPLHAQSVD